MKATLQLGMKQQFTLTPKLRQAIRLLQLSTVELNQEIRVSLETNPFLEQEEAQSNETEDCAGLDLETLSKDTWEEFHQYLHSSSGSSTSIDLMQLRGTDTTLQSHLLWQMELAPFTEKERAIAMILIDSISDDGYLTSGLNDVQDSIGTSEIALVEIESVLNRIQQFEPLGVGARTLTECLCIQLNAFPAYTPCLEEAKALATNYLNLLAKKDYSKLCAALNISSEKLFSAIKVLTSLNPKPGTLISSTKKPDYIIPDLVVVKKNERYHVSLNRTHTPRIKIMQGFETLATQGKYNREISMLKEQWHEARWLIKTLQTRNKILLNVADTIIKAQTEFLEFGQEKMKPLNLLDIAKEVGLHESTISRVTSNKYILTHRGVFELKFFFSNAINAGLKNNKSSASSSAIRALIKKWIAKEDLATPLSDQQIVQLLLKEGIHIARRTITKYREGMSIPSSTERKSFVLNPR